MSSAKFDVQPEAALYDSDFYAWSQQQVRLLRAGLACDLDVENIAEEIESLGKSVKKELGSRLKLLLLHLLKWQYQPGPRGASWQATIRIQRRDLADHLEENPSLRRDVPEVLAKMFDKAVFLANAETGLPETAFPKICPWTFDQAMDLDFWP